MARDPKPAIGLVMLSDTKILNMATGRFVDAQRIGDLVKIAVTHELLW
jgi:hypothetical protein